jgi:PAS domain S-box-containing protein
MLVVDDHGRIALFNAQACSLFGRDEASAVGSSLDLICSSEPGFAAHDLGVAFDRARRDGKLTFEWRSHNASGSAFWNEMSVCLLPVDGKTYLVASIRDVDARKRIEGAQRSSEERFATIFNATSTMFAFTEPLEGRIIDVNQPWLTANGLTREQALGRTGSELNLWARAQDREVIMALLAGSGRAKDVETTFTMGGRTFPALVNVESVRLRGEPYNLWEIRDISEQKRALAEQEQLRAELLQAQKMELVGQLAGGVAHDFNNILSIILSLTGLVAEEFPAGDSRREDLGEVLRAGERAAQLTRQLLAFSRKQTMQRRVLDPIALVSGMQPMLRRLLGESIQLQIVLPPSCGLIKADPSHVEQAIMNLVVNARDAMPQTGKVTIQVGDAKADGQDQSTLPGSFTMISVTDTGSGMDADTLARAFEPFFTTKEPGHGTGLGLSTVFGVVKQCGGDVRIRSAAQAGTTVRMYFPHTSGQIATEPTARSRVAKSGTPRTILLVEDDAQVRALVKGILQRASYRVLEAADPLEALALVDRHSGDLHMLLTDMVMPHMNGRALGQKLAVARPSLRMLFMSGYTESTADPDGTLQIGLNFIPKPITPDRLLAMVERVLEG